MNIKIAPTISQFPSSNVLQLFIFLTQNAPFSQASVASSCSPLALLGFFYTLPAFVWTQTQRFHPCTTLSLLGFFYTLPSSVWTQTKRFHFQLSFHIPTFDKIALGEEIAPRERCTKSGRRGWKWRSGRIEIKWYKMNGVRVDWR
jgi:hypothetical protein